jgi:hypothetical protein
VEDQRGWSLLYDANGNEKKEEALQLLFLGMSQHYLRLFGVEVDREVELGRGPVDFKISSGSKMRLLIEMKKLHNGKFWNGIQSQLPSYLTSDDCGTGWYLAVQYRVGGQAQQRLRELPGIVAGVAEASGKTLYYATIDATRKVSASKIEEADS